MSRKLGVVKTFIKLVNRGGQALVDVDLILDGRSVLEYESSTNIKQGDYIEMSHKQLTGTFRVTKITHKVVQLKQDERLVQYLEIEVERVK